MEATATATLKEKVTAIASKWNWKLNEKGEQFHLDISIKLKDGSFRYQWVYIWMNPRDEGKTIYMNSRVGRFNEVLLQPIVRASGGMCRNCNLAIVKDTYNGQPVESFIIQAIPDATITEEALDKLIFEVANTADYLEETFFGGDNV